MILEGAPQTRDVLDHRAQAHIAVAALSNGARRCHHLQMGSGFAALASSSELLAAARYNLRDAGCPVGNF